MTAVAFEDSRDADRFGGKAVQLGAALRGGLPVPRGAALSVALVDAIAAGNPAASADLERVWSALRPPLAVRSSAVGEDSSAASFAGQHFTCLNVRSAAGAIEAVTAIWRSAHCEGARAYRQRLGLSDTPRVAVVLQELIDADCAGVLFTRNPIDGADELVVEAAWGLGEAVVAGLVTPDRFRIARDGTVLERVAGQKDLAVRLAAGEGTQEVPVPSDRVRALCLDDRALATLARLAERCKSVVAGARDLEWAFVGETLHLLQCRRVTKTFSRTP